MALKTSYRDIIPYVTKDGSEVRELMHPDIHGNARQSLAEATVPVGGETLLHRHMKSEEIYHITQGEGLMSLGDEEILVKAGDTVSIPAETAHKIRNMGLEPLILLCSCSPEYSHDDTEILANPAPSPGAA